MKNDREREDERKNEIAASVEIAARGQRARRFLREDFWKMDLEPSLAKTQAEAEAQKGWRPGGAKSIDESALCNAYFTAVEETVGDVLRKIKLMVAAGEEAEAYLKKQAENTK